MWKSDFKFHSLCPFVHLSRANEFYKFLIFLILDLIIFFNILQHVDQKITAIGSSKKHCYFFWKFFCLDQWAILIPKIIYPHNYGSALLKILNNKMDQNFIAFPKKVLIVPISTFWAHKWYIVRSLDPF